MRFPNLQFCGSAIGRSDDDVLDLGCMAIERGSVVEQTLPKLPLANPKSLGTAALIHGKPTCNWKMMENVVGILADR